MRRHQGDHTALEELAGVRAGRDVCAEVATRSNAFHVTGLQPDGRETAEAVRGALDETHMAAEDIDYVNAHGSGTKQKGRHRWKRSLIPTESPRPHC